MVREGFMLRRGPPARSGLMSYAWHLFCSVVSSVGLMHSTPP